MQITELEVWKAGIELAKTTYEITEKFPEAEKHGLAYQLRRAVSNIPANVSAAASRKHGKESLRHLFRARDMIYEVESHFYLSNKLGFITDDELETMLENLNTSKRLLFGFIKYYKRSNSYEGRSGGRQERRPDHDDHDVDHEIGEEEDEF